MLSSRNKIIKAHTANIDSENKVLIDVSSFEFEYGPVQEEEGDLSLIEELDESAAPEELAQSVIINANRKSEAIIKDALKEADQIVQEAKEKATREAEALIEGFREQGYNEGMQRAEQDGESIRTQAEGILEDAKRRRQDMEESLEPDIIELIVKITAKLLGDTASLNPLIIMNLIKQGLSGATITGDVTVHVSPVDYENVADNKDAILAMADGTVRLEVMSDPSLSPMDCVIETPYGNIDCSLGQQFDGLRSNLTYILSNIQ
jgi:flagellar assembly protein FliH